MLINGTTMNNQQVLIHHGIKGQRWGVRRYQNEDGSLTAAGKRRLSSEYERSINKGDKDLSKKYNQMQADAYNKAANTMNSSKIAEYNESQKKTYGEDFAKREGYVSDYYKIFEAEIQKEMNKSLYNFYSTNKNYKKAIQLASDYGMESWDDLVKKNSKAIAELKTSI